MDGKPLHRQHEDKENNHACQFDHWLRPLHQRL
jgi:hypothetical protein